MLGWLRIGAYALFCLLGLTALSFFAYRGECAKSITAKEIKRYKVVWVIFAVLSVLATLVMIYYKVVKNFDVLG